MIIVNRSCSFRWSLCDGTCLLCCPPFPQFWWLYSCRILWGLSPGLEILTSCVHFHLSHYLYSTNLEKVGFRPDDTDRGITPLLVLWGYIHILFFASKYANAYLDKHLSENPAKGERQKKNLPQWLISTWGAQLCCDKTSSGPMRWWLQTEWQLHVSKQKNPNAPQPCLISANRG